MWDLKNSLRSLDKRVIRIQDSQTFFNLLDNMLMAKCEFSRHREILLDAYVSGDLYTIVVVETDKLFREYETRHKLASALGTCPSNLTLPAFCLAKEGRCELIWTQEPLRCQGFASMFIKELKITSTNQQLNGSVNFWRSRNILSSYH